MEQTKFCERCEMSLREKKDFGGRKLDNKYCVYCSDKDGNLYDYEIVLSNMKNFIMKTSGISEDKALKTAKENMAKMSAWAK